jgi:hypothetical protein
MVAGVYNHRNNRKHFAFLKNTKALILSENEKDNHNRANRKNSGDQGVYHS